MGCGGARHRLRLFVAGQGVNGLGSMISSVALPLVAVDRLHASTFVVGLLEAVEWIPAVMIGVPAGALLDRSQARSRSIMMAANVGQAAATAVVPATAAAGLLDLPVLLAAAVTTGFFTVFFQAGYAPYLRSLVPADGYASATAQLQAAQSAARLTGPAVAGALAEAVGAAATVLADAGSFLISFLSLALSPPTRSPPPSPTNPQPLRSQILDGLSHLGASPLLRTLATATATANLFLTAIGAIEIPFLVRDVGASAVWIGGLFALGGTGGLAGSLLLTRAAHRFGLEPIARTAIAITAPAALLIPLTHHGAAIAFFAIAAPPTSFGIALASASFLTLRLHHTPPELQARISAASRTLTAATIPIGALLGGALAQLLGNRTALLLLAAGYLTFGLSLLRNPNLHRTARSPRP
jgi:predicted MFS family arabinose efflux permease